MRVINHIFYQAIFVISLMALCSFSPAKTIYVDDDVVGANNGTSLENAKEDKKVDELRM